MALGHTPSVHQDLRRLFEADHFVARCERVTRERQQQRTHPARNARMAAACHRRPWVSSWRGGIASDDSAPRRERVPRPRGRVQCRSLQRNRRIVTVVGGSRAAVRRTVVGQFQTTRITPAMAAGVTERLWEVSDIVRTIEDAAPKPNRPGQLPEAGRDSLNCVDQLNRQQRTPERVSTPRGR